MTSFEARLNQFSINMELMSTSPRLSDEEYYQSNSNVHLNSLSVIEVDRLLNADIPEYNNYDHLFANVNGYELNECIGFTNICEIMIKRNNRQLTTKMMTLARSVDKCVQNWKKYGIKQVRLKLPISEFTTGIIRRNGEEDPEGWIIYKSHLFPKEVAACLIPTWSQYINNGMHADPEVVKRHFNF